MPKIKVENVEISVIKAGGEDYISLTDMVREVENGSALIEKWLRNKNTIEFLGIWEEMYNPDFNSPEFGGIMAEAGTNRFLLSVKQWIEMTNARGIVAKAGRYGGTYVRDYATINQLICFSNMENINAVMINDGVPQPQRLKRLNEIAIHQMRVLSQVDNRNLLK